METVLITGGTGLIGKALTKELVTKGYRVIILTRRENKTASKGEIQYAHWDIEKQLLDKEAIWQADYIIHLAGANVADQRWMAKRKKEILESRTKTAGLLVRSLQEVSNKVKAVISSSAIGWYGADSVVPNPNPFIETDPPDNSFLGETCKAWEESIEPVQSLGKRLIKLRTGIVLSKEGGAYTAFKKPIKFGAASVLGNGKQVISWIHINDIVGAFVFALENEQMKGVYNAVAPQPVNNKRLITTMAAENGGIKIPIHVPEFALKALLGEMSVEVLKSATVSSKKIEEAGYVFQFPSIEAAIKNLK